MGLLSSSYLSLWGLLVVFFLLSASMTNAKCLRNWVDHKGSCFGYFISPMNWGDAEVACQTYGPSGHLASILDEQEMKTVSTYVSRNYKGDKRVWIGLYDTKTGSSGRTREFKWTDGSQARYMPWAPAEPNAKDGKEFCVELNAKDFKDWNDANCEIKQPYLCKMTS